MWESQISTADRERALRELSQQLGDGRLSTVEFEQRCTIACEATSMAELAELFADLPRPQLPPPLPTRTRQWIHRPAILILPLSAIPLVLSVATGNLLWLLAIAPIAMLHLIDPER
ncbi:DUF1707 domain-containing protein [Nocardia sp. NBC_00511]|uniref:DUF1707 SHOCT-like domain-containing protein n=1 Tax=Nocardia sp. NBC_00511 TaxID=2903591 RepID=UPI002F90D88F